MAAAGDDDVIGGDHRAAVEHQGGQSAPATLADRLTSHNRERFADYAAPPGLAPATAVSGWAFRHPALFT